MHKMVRNRIVLFHIEKCCELASIVSKNMAETPFSNAK
jgi:hypothetical protein